MAYIVTRKVAKLRVHVGDKLKVFKTGEALPADTSKGDIATFLRLEYIKASKEEPKAPAQPDPKKLAKEISKKLEDLTKEELFELGKAVGIGVDPVNMKKDEMVAALLHPEKLQDLAAKLA